MGIQLHGHGTRLNQFPTLIWLVGELQRLSSLQSREIGFHGIECPNQSPSAESVSELMVWFKIGNRR